MGGGAIILCIRHKESPTCVGLVMILKITTVKAEEILPFWVIKVIQHVDVCCNFADG